MGKIVSSYITSLVFVVSRNIRCFSLMSEGSKQKQKKGNINYYKTNAERKLHVNYLYKV
jgi:hypothetical protein